MGRFLGGGGGGGGEHRGVETRGLLAALVQVSVTSVLKCYCGMSGHARVKSLREGFGNGVFFFPPTSNAVM